MKVFAIGAITKPPTPEQQAELMPREVPATLQHYLDGKIEQFWFRQDRLGVVFYLDVESVEGAEAEVGKLPLTEGGFMTYEFIPVGPLAPLGRLIQSK
ncbi:hypothetical protein [Labrys wisconsinensis]|uniref:Muconolactone isomerase domain-containing protein n=1 Tax=Labrys wisconsinensis TaxID=425677 RepID=A0ABU0JII6_9HYPH|nr:hypothetical protein [Labrys wisconsinensis]MDQ0472952.1 hypothetical protein [Labrys wisconsinensis]